jgi:hypothetical protein
VEYQLAGQRTGGLLRLVLANTTYVSHPTFTGVGADKTPASSNSSTAKQTAKQYRQVNMHCQILRWCGLMWPVGAEGISSFQLACRRL